MVITVLLSLFGLFVSPVPQAQAHPVVHEHSARATAASVRQRETRIAPAPIIPVVQEPASTQVAAKPATSQKLVSTKSTTTATPKPAPAQAPAPQPDFARTVEQEIFRLINAERAKAGLGKVGADTKLDSIARAHSADMLAKDYFSHTNKSGCDSMCRVTKAGYEWRMVGENIYTMTGYDLSAAETAKMMVEGWMDSPGHRANILKTGFTSHGVGIAIEGSTVYATSLFATPK